MKSLDPQVQVAWKNDRKMVAQQNGDRHNGHVLLADQQTRLEPDSEVQEPASKSKVYLAKCSRLALGHKEER